MTQIEPALTSERNTYSSAAERWQEQRRLVSSVAAAYKAVKDLLPVIAFNPDPDTRSNSNRWSPDSTHYVTDVENTVRRVIESKPPQEHSTARNAWENLLSDDDKIGSDERKLIRLLAGPFFTKKLHPGLYFATNRYGHRRAK